MNKKILISLSVIGAVAAIAIGGTIAYFSDTETSTGNTFTAGSLDLTIDNECYYNGMLCECESEVCYWDGNSELGECTCTWDLDDLTGKVFFNFTDLKPGDWGEDTVSLHVTNDAWACVAIKPTANDDVSCTEPEMGDDPDCDEPGNPANLWDGDLAQELFFFFWVDDGDNVWEEGEEMLMYGSADDILEGTIYTLADSTENNVGGKDGEPLYEGTTYYIGKAWCFGEWNGQEGPCDGYFVNNASQSDSLTGDITFYAEQARNNPNFRCVPPETTTVQSAVFNFSSTGWAGWSCPAAYPNIVSADTTNCTQPLAISKAANSSDGQYPVYPHYTYNQAAGETGWVLQNGGTPQSCYIVITCSE